MADPRLAFELAILADRVALRFARETRKASPAALRATALRELKRLGFDLSGSNQITKNGKHLDKWLTLTSDGFQVHDRAAKLLWSGKDIAAYIERDLG